MRKIALFLVLVSPLLACTGLRVTAEDGSSVNGRTLEFGVVIDLYATVVPRNLNFQGTTPIGKGLSYTSKYAAVGIACFDDPSLMDGMNEKGLCAGAFYFPGFAGYSEITKENRSQSLSPIEFVHWILTQFASLDEVKEALASIVLAPTIMEAWGDAPIPLHYIVYDREGKSIAIEPMEGELIVHDNPLGVMTNSPTFDWHMMNLRNFIHLDPSNVAPTDLGKVTLAPFGQGSGMVGLPGDFTPPSRFVRAAFFSANAPPLKSGEATIAQAFHLLNPFDIPLGIAREKTKKGMAADYTLATCVKDPQSLRYYYKSYDNQAIQFVDLKKFNLNAKAIKRTQVTGKQTMIDASALLK
ncbi:MAG: choloylglycine hydrolase family protein [Verrucomicrobiota bacterium]|nr:choloylglycine hydrolase family protein [Verrucomicrobiota bacterium]